MKDFYTVTEYAKLIGKDSSHIRRMLIYGKLAGEKLGNQWVIPKNAEYPQDSRVKSGEYKNWRKKISVRSNNPDFFAILHKMCKQLSEIYGSSLDRIVLYGSYARGDQSTESDADVAVLLNDECTEEIHDKMVDAVVDYELEAGITISVVQLDKKHYDEWNKTLPYYINIEKEGIILWKAA